MKWLISTAGFVYDFLADDGWELLVGLLVLLPLTHFVSQASDALAGIVLVGGIILTVSVSLYRRLPRRSTI